MKRTVHCVVLNKQAEAMDRAPYPGKLGERIVEQVSAEGWQAWLQRLTLIINENGLNTADPACMPLIEEHMRGFLFGEGNMGQRPEGFH